MRLGSALLHWRSIRTRGLSQKRKYIFPCSPEEKSWNYSDTKLPVLSRYSLVGIRELLAADSAPGVVPLILTLVSLFVDRTRMLGLWNKSNTLRIRWIQCHILTVMKRRWMKVEVTYFWGKGTMKSIVFWDITPCSLLKVNRHFGGTYRLHLRGRKICRARNQRESRWQTEPFQRAFNSLHGVISQKIVLFITTAVITSNPTGAINLKE
jgi:hypothetical protein